MRHFLLSGLCAAALLATALPSQASADGWHGHHEDNEHDEHYGWHHEYRDRDDWYFHPRWVGTHYIVAPVPPPVVVTQPYYYPMVPPPPPPVFVEREPSFSIFIGR